MLHKVKMSMWH